MTDSPPERVAQALALGVVATTLLFAGDLLVASLGLVGQLLFQTFLVLAPALLWGALAGGGMRERLPLGRPGAASLLAALVLIPAAGVAATWIAIRTAQWVPVPPALAAGLDRLAGEARERPLLGVLSLVVAPALAEEALFRGALLGWLGSRMGTRPAVALQAACFAAFHLSPHRLAPQLLLGIVLGALVRSSRSLWPAIALHAGYNFAILRHGGALAEAAGSRSGALGAAALGACGVALLLARRGAPERTSRRPPAEFT